VVRILTLARRINTYAPLWTVTLCIVGYTAQGHDRSDKGEMCAKGRGPNWGVSNLVTDRAAAFLEFKWFKHLVTDRTAAFLGFKHLVTDRAAAFLGSVMTFFCELFDITKISTDSFSPHSNRRVAPLQGT